MREIIVGMELVPALKIGWLNGWIFLVLLYLVEGSLVLSFPKDKRGWLFEYDHSKWNKKHLTLFIIGKSFSVIYLILMIFTPLKIISAFFIPGILLYTVGLVGFAIAIINFKNKPADKPVTLGLYQISRNPQVLMLFILALGICLTIGSGITLIILIFSTIFNRVRILEEEKACLKRYGALYWNYMKKVPRYILIKTKIKE